MPRYGIALALLLAFATVGAASDLTGRVVDASGKAVAGAHVYVYQAFPRIGVSAFCPSCYRDCGTHEPVDAKGAFLLQKLDPSLLFDVLAVANGYDSAITRRVDPLRGPITIELRPRSIADADRLITGVVVDPEGKAVVGAVVEPSGYHTTRLGSDGIRRPSVGFGNLPGLEQLSITDAKGEFALRIPETTGKLDVRATARSFAPHIDRELAPGERRRIVLTEGATVTGLVLKDGKPAAGVPVAFVQRSRRSSDFLGRVEIGTNEDGRFVMTNLGTNESYVVHVPMESVRHGAAMPVVLYTGPNQSSTDLGALTIAPGRRVRGRISVPEGATIPPDTRVLLISELSNDARIVELNHDRTFVFDSVPRGDVSISMQIPGLELSPRSERFVDEGLVSLPPDGDVSGVELIFDCQ